MIPLLSPAIGCIWASLAMGSTHNRALYKCPITLLTYFAVLTFCLSVCLSVCPSLSGTVVITNYTVMFLVFLTRSSWFKNLGLSSDDKGC